MKTTMAAILFAGVMTSALAQDVNDDGWVTTLLPIALGSHQTIQGAYGTVWSQETWILNGSTIPFSHWPYDECRWSNCPPWEAQHPAGSIKNENVFSSNAGYGALIHVPVAAADQVHMSARLLETSLRSQPTGVEIPVVAEADFFSGERWLLGVPSSPAIRTALRIYAPRRGYTAVQVDFIALDGETIATTILQPGAGSTSTEPLKYAGVASILDVTGTYPALLAHHSFHIRMRPLESSREYWAFANVTENETQHVLLITARP